MRHLAIVLLLSVPPALAMAQGSAGLERSVSSAAAGALSASDSCLHGSGPAAVPAALFPRPQAFEANAAEPQAAELQAAEPQTPGLQPPGARAPLDGSDRSMTGNLRTDLLGQTDLWDSPPEQSGSGSERPEGWKSPWLAGGLSAVVPGSGQIYAGNWWKAAIFLAIEAAAITYAVSNDSKGDDQTDFYQSYAETHWDVVRYAQWTDDNVAAPDRTYLWDLGNGQVDWNELNRMEREIGSWYSHTLPPYQSQQYYELIGKYPQFAQGWDDANPNVPPDYESAKANLPPNYLYYSGERGKANDYYSKSETGVLVIVINHILSAADAAWTASTHNKGLSAGIGLQAVPPGARSLAGPAVKLSYGL